MTQNNIHIGNAPCSWGTLEFEGMEEKRLGYEQMLAELVEAGYTGTELGDWGFMPTDPAALRSEIEKRNITMTGAFVPVALKNPNAHAPGTEKALKVARLIAGASPQAAQKPFLVLADDNGQVYPIRTQNAGRVTPEMGLSDTEWQTFAAGAERIARTVREETGLRTVFHHHCAGYIETPDETARLLALTDPDLLGLVFDTGHFAFGAGQQGCDAVLEGLNRFADRIWYVHFKDFDPNVAQQVRANNWDYFNAIKHGIFCELGQGCVDFPAVLAWLREHNYQGYITVEQDLLPGLGAPKESAQRSRDYLRSIGV